MFNTTSFDVFAVAGLAPRMNAIRTHIQPVFREIWEDFCPRVAELHQRDYYIHIAQHLRRTTHAPESTWSAISTTKRGYKSQPHFQLGIWKDYVFLYLSIIDNPKNEQALATTLLDNLQVVSQLPEDFIYSVDHTQSPVFSVSSDTLHTDITRFRDIKKAEFEVGRILSADSSLWDKPAAARDFLWETMVQLMPLYTLLLPHID